MVLTCSGCKHTWEVSAGHILGARLKFGLGFEERAFTCPNCNAKNTLTAAEFESANRSESHMPATGTSTQTEADTAHPPRASNTGGRAPTNPVPGPDLSSRQIELRSMDDQLFQTVPNILSNSTCACGAINITYS